MNVVTNHQLFSHTYLAQLQADPSSDEEAAPIAQGLRDWMPFRDTSSLQALMDSWVGPVLDFLEFHHAPADDVPHIRLLYARRGDETPVGLCYVVPSGQDLDDTTKGRHPMAQVVLALRARDLRWGMLTDGARWRLVDAQALRRYEHYVEVDLDGLARSDDPTPLRLFYAFFHRSAFTPAHPPAGGGTEGGGENGLDRLVAASAQATKAAEDHLKARVSHNEGIMAQLCLGLVRADGQARYTEAERDAIYRDATYLLYRMLFILYAEARGLLPMDNPTYRAVSLAELVKTAHDYKLRGMPDPQAKTLWDRLKRLCNAIYESDPELGIPAYNGGLFDDADKPYLRDGYIADAYLTEAIFDLAYRPDPALSRVEGADAADGYRPIDYRDLSVRHLGSLYEGMIEYKLQIAEETLWARRDGKGNVRFLHTGDDGAPRKTDVEIEPGQVYFSQSPGERRATGTYYTPEYIVDYIVRQTVVRGLEKRRAPLEEKLAGWLEEIAATTDPDERMRMGRTADEELLRFVEEQVLTFQACDPAMGSGHFLVNAAHQITNFIVETLHLTPWFNETMDADPVAWRRRVVERCVYGVDLSLMAVELAKLSLWLASVAEGKPLSFLDHHLRQGNSLIGARLEELAEFLAGATSTKPSRRERKEREAGQLSMLDGPVFSQHVMAATDLLAQISARAVERVEDVKAQEADYEQVRAELEPYRLLADLWTARHFGLKADERQLHDISKYLVNGAVSPVPEYERLLTQAQELASERSFFNWELEFPEIFLDKRDWSLEDKPGFNAVIGNPPYVRQEELIPFKAYFAISYPEFYYGTADLFVYFFGQGLRLLRRRGRLSYISSNSWLRANYARPLRVFLRTKVTVETLVDLGDNRAFAEVPDVYPAIPVVRRELPPTDYTANAAVFTRGEGLACFEQRLETKFCPVTIHDQPDDGWRLESQVVRALLRKVAAQGTPLGQAVNGQIYYGVKTGLNKAFIIDQDTRDRLIQSDPNCEAIIKPLVNGSDVRPWYIQDEGRWLIFARRGININSYPSVKAHLEKFREELEPRPLDWDRTRRWPGRKSGLYKWYEIQDPVDYYHEFDKPKIFWPEMAKYPRFALAHTGIVGNKTTFMIPDNNPYVLGILMSRVTWFAVSGLCQPIGERAGMLRYTLSGQFMKLLPIPNAPEPQRADIAEIACQTSAKAQARYNLHRQTRHRILTELGTPGTKLNNKLTSWWELDFPVFRTQVKKALRHDIPEREWDKWEQWLSGQRAEHEWLTAEIVRLETDLNAHVYVLFDLTPTEIQIIEESTKYRYGEV